MRKSLKALSYLILSAVTPIASAWQPQNIVVFGDSLSDYGNKHQSYHLPVSPPYWEGRYTNGPVWVEYLALRFNLIPNPWVDPKATHESLMNYAMGDSVVLESNVLPDTPTQTLMQQLSLYQTQTPSNPRGTLAIIWEGVNDFKNPVCVQSPFSCVKDMIHTQAKAIDTLYEMGIRHFVVLTAPDITITPLVAETTDEHQREIISGLIKYYNNNLALIISQFQDDKEDAYILKIGTNSLITTLKKSFKQPMSVSCYANKGIYNKDMGTPCPPNQQDQFFFWDSTHPTTKAHAMLAEKVFEQIQLAKWQ